MDIFPLNDVHLAEKMNKKKLIDFQRKRKWSGTFEMKNCNSGWFQTKKKKQTHRDVIHAWFCACINNWITMKQVVCHFYKGNLIWIFHWICVTNGKTKKSLQDIGIYRFYLLIKNRLFLFKKLKNNALWPPFDAFEIETFEFFFEKTKTGLSN